MNNKRFKIPLKIKFRKKLSKSISNEKILGDFIINLKIKGFNTFYKNNNELYASNKTKTFWDFNKTWKDKENVTIRILSNKEINYILDFSGLYKEFKTILIATPFALFLFYYTGMLKDLIAELGIFLSFSFFVIFMILFHIFLFGLLILRHRNIFRNTLKYGAGNIKYYNWEKIMKYKTEKELNEIIKGHSNYSDRVIIFAKKELEERLNNKQN